MILTHYYSPEVGAPQTRLSALANGLAAAGHNITVHTCAPHYPAGRVMPGYRTGWWQEHSGCDVRVIRSVVWPAPNSGFSRRLADHATFALGAVATAHRVGNADTVITESPPLFLAAAAPAYARRLGARLVLNVSDLWPESAVALGVLKSRSAIALARGLANRAYRSADVISVPTAGLVAALQEYPSAAGKVHRMLPMVDLLRFAEVDEIERATGPLRVLYAGTIGLAQGLNGVIDVAAGMQGDVELTIAGDGAEAAAVRDRAAGRPNVRLLGPVPADQIPRLYSENHVAVVPLRDVPLFRGALPTKVFEAMAARRPVLVAARGELANLVEGALAGEVVPPEDPAALHAALGRLALASEEELRRMGEAGRRAAARYSVEAGVQRWRDLLEGLVDLS